MKNDFDYSIVPYTFLHCIKAECSLANDCLRHKVMKHVTIEQTGISIVNPIRIPENAENCNYFYPDRMSRFALGITHLLDNIPHTLAIEIKRELSVYFKKNTYYRIRNKERLIKPSEQELIRWIFIQKGITEEPVFDKYIEQYDW